MPFCPATSRAAALLAAIFIFAGHAGGATAAGNSLDAEKARAYQNISGSPWPGVIDHLLEQPTECDARGGGLAIHINYPSFGRPDIDGDIRAWVTGLADAFASHLDIAGTLQRENDGHADSAGGETEFSSGSETHEPVFELWGGYEVCRPSDNAVSITFELWNYAGSPHGNLDIVTLNYSLLSGQRLGLVDLFDNPDIALDLMSGYARHVLEKRLGAHGRQMMDGTAPLVENYSSLTLVPGGLRINFQPYQVSSRAAGVQQVNMPLSELLPAGPMLDLWGRREE